MFDGLKLRKRVNELEEQMLKLTRVIEAHDLEWADMRARCKRLLDRTEKAARRVDQGIESDSAGISQGREAQPEGNGMRLTPAQAILQAKIISRRRLTQ